MSFDRSITPGAAADASLGVAGALDVLRGRSNALSRADALQLVATSAFPNRHRVFQSVLEDERAPSRLRYLAAVNLARCDRGAALAILFPAISVADPVVLAGVMRAVGQIGDEAALRAVEHALPRAEGRARVQALFARTLIIHRLGLADRVAASPQAAELLELSTDGGRRVLIRPARSHVAVQALTSLGERPYGIELVEDPMFEFVCDRCRGTIMLNREFAEREAIAVLRKRPAIYAIGTLWNATRDGLSAAAVVLTTPDAGGREIRVAIHLTSGELVFAGAASLDGGVARWSLRAVRRFGGFPIRAQGSLSSDGLRIDEAASATRVTQRRHPTPIVMGRIPRVVNLRVPPTDA